jgi:hypothetical protein
LGRKEAKQYYGHIATYPPFKPLFDKWHQSEKAPLDEAELISNVNSVLNSQGFTKNRNYQAWFHNLASQVPFYQSAIAHTYGIDIPDTTFENYVENFKKQNPSLQHAVVPSNPSATAKWAKWLINRERLLTRTFNNVLSGKFKLFGQPMYDSTTTFEQSATNPTQMSELNSEAMPPVFSTEVKKYEPPSSSFADALGLWLTNNVMYMMNDAYTDNVMEYLHELPEHVPVPGPQQPNKGALLPSLPITSAHVDEKTLQNMEANQQQAPPQISSYGDYAFTAPATVYDGMARLEKDSEIKSGVNNALKVTADKADAAKIPVTEIIHNDVNIRLENERNRLSLERPSVESEDPFEKFRNMALNSHSDSEVDRLARMTIQHSTFNSIYDQSLAHDILSNIDKFIVTTEVLLKGSLHGARNVPQPSSTPLQDLFKQYPNMFNNTMDLNDILNKLKDMRASAVNMYNEIGMSHTENHSFAQLHYLLARSAIPPIDQKLKLDYQSIYKKLETELNTNSKLSDLQKEMIRQWQKSNYYYDTPILKNSRHHQNNWDVTEYFKLMNELRSDKSSAFDSNAVATLFDNDLADTEINANAEKRNIHEIYKKNLEGAYHHAMSLGHVGVAYQYLNAIHDPSLRDEEALEKTDYLSLNSRFLNYNNEVVKKIYGYNDIDKTIDQQVVDNFNNVKNILSGFLAHKSLDNTPPTHASASEFYERYQTLLDSMKSLPPTSILGNAIKNSLVMKTLEDFTPNTLPIIFENPTSHLAQLEAHKIRNVEQLTSDSQHEIINPELAPPPDNDNQPMTGRGIYNKFNHRHNHHENHRHNKHAVDKMVDVHFMPHKNYELKMHHVEKGLGHRESLEKRHESHYKHMHNILHKAGIIKHIANTHPKPFSPHHYVLNSLHEMKHRNINPIEKDHSIKGCGMCGGHERLMVHNKDHNDMTCSPCLHTKGMTSNRYNPLKVDLKPIEESSHPSHKAIHNKIQLNKYIDKVGAGTHQNNWESFKTSFPHSTKFSEVWGKSYVSKRDNISNKDLDKIVYGIGKFLYDEEDVSESFLDNLNALIIKYLHKIDPDDKIHKAHFSERGMHNYDKLKKAIIAKPGILKTLLLDLH